MGTIHGLGFFPLAGPNPLLTLSHNRDMYFVAGRQMLPYGLGVPSILFVMPYKNFELENKDYGGLSLIFFFLINNY